MIHNPTDDYQPPHHGHDQRDACSPCPACGQPYEPALIGPFHSGASTVFDWPLIVEEDPRQLKRVVEEVAL
jgi:hypothetical protein